MTDDESPRRRRSSARGRPSRRWRRLTAEVGAAIAVGLLVGLAIDVVRSGGPETWLSARGIRPAYEPGGRQVETGGPRLYLDCRGVGRETVVLENGLGSGADGWGFVLSGLAERTRVCAYDRAGIGRSGATDRHSVVDAVRWLDVALRAHGERPPWIVVGHSLGGVYARVFAGREDSGVVGVVLVDAFYPDADLLRGIELDPALSADWDADLEATEATIERVEHLDWPRSLRDLGGSSLQGLPLEVLAVDQRLRYGDPRLPATTRASIIARWERWVHGLSPGATRLTIAEHSGHLIQLDRPDLVIASVERLLQAP